MIIADTPEGVERVRIMALRSALSLEIHTGMKYSKGRSANQIATELLKEHGWIEPHKRPNKRTTYRILNEVMVKSGFEDRPLD